MRIEKVDVFPAISVCVIERTSDVARLLAQWAQNYDKGWKRSYISLAPSYRISVGKTEILVLRRGLAVAIRTFAGEGVAYSFELPEGDAERIVREACPAK